MGSTPMILCHCHVVSDRAVATAVLGGARTLSSVCRSTGAGRDCGACVLSVKKCVNDVVSLLETDAADRESEVA
jgi:bacterioferritin-associated ferredoxin